ncbi:DDE_3 domain-containing protein [Trichonephila clavipes]|nr:DDE_3 domain-containing protein [Trichonephila clavipes]
MRGTLTGQRYVDDILRPHVGPFLNGLPGAIFQQDNARPHTARVAQDFLRHFKTFPWPSRSPDLFPVEHVCTTVSSREVGGREMRGGRLLTLPQDVLPQNWSGTELNRTVTCVVLKATDNDRRTSSLLP